MDECVRRRCGAQSRFGSKAAEHHGAGQRRRGGEVDRRVTIIGPSTSAPNNSSLFPANSLPDLDVKLPSVVCVSTESTRHVTWYVPAARSVTIPDIWLPLTRGFPVSTR